MTTVAVKSRRGERDRTEAQRPGSQAMVGGRPRPAMAPWDGARSAGKFKDGVGLGKAAKEVRPQSQVARPGCDRTSPCPGQGKLPCGGFDYI
jgi:hypothetical protein